MIRAAAVGLLAGVLLLTATSQTASAQEPEGVDAIPAVEEVPAGADGAELPPASPLPTLIMFAGLIALWFYVIIRPQQKERAKRTALIDSLRPHVEVVTLGGIHGKIVKATEGSATVTLQVDQNCRLTINRDAIRDIIDPDEAAETPPAEKT